MGVLRDRYHSLRTVTALPDTTPSHPADLSHEVLLEETFELTDAWESSVEFGANGSEGNSQVFNLRVGVDSEPVLDEPEEQIKNPLAQSENQPPEERTRHGIQSTLLCSL